MMKVSSTETIAGYTIVETLGIVEGSTVRARNIGRDLFAGLKNVIGGEISEYTKLLSDCREVATERMEKQAHKMGADAVVNVRYTTAGIAQGASEVLAFGTAVKIVKNS